MDEYQILAALDKKLSNKLFEQIPGTLFFSNAKAQTYAPGYEAKYPSINRPLKNIRKRLFESEMLSVS
jgi:hypothetical protein